MGTLRPFNLSKQARRYPPNAFDSYSPEKSDPYRRNTGKPGSENTSDKLRMLSQPSPGSPMPGGGAGQLDNKEWPSGPSWLVDDENRPRHDNGEGAQTPYGSEAHDSPNPELDDSVIGIHETTERMMDDNHRDRKPYNVNSNLGVMRQVRQRLRTMN